MNGDLAEDNSLSLAQELSPRYAILSFRYSYPSYLATQYKKSHIIIITLFVYGLPYFHA
ncbi:hypothetical protein Smp_179840 [Schistosoma mansoni]|uniref:hypothetical protein n=1 Tax=Schistosoma mansoni TaxID=6183 RepID=UPI0001A6268F|nr:hypothetical protein Smp_179840 [Schistosoma mansoni]|eukprot:XP_018655461.1 hypothetical protein Smp_179840 [Schistosoma mansoni]